MKLKQKVPKQKLFTACALSFLALLFMTSHAFAAQVTLFSKTYHKDKGKPVSYTDQINVSSDHKNLQLSVENGADGSGEVKNVEIVLNGVTVVSNSDMKAANNKIVSLPWQQTNELEVTLKGQGGKSISVELLADFSDPMAEFEMPGGGL